MLRDPTERTGSEEDIVDQTEGGLHVRVGDSLTK